MSTITTPITLDENPIATLQAAIKRDAVINSPGAGEASQLSVEIMKPLPFDREKSLASRAPTVAAAQSEFAPSKRFNQALSDAKAIHEKAHAIGLKIRDIFSDKIRAQHHKLLSAATKKLIDGQENAFEGLESESDLVTRFQSEIDSRQAAMSAFGFQQIEHAIVIRDELDASLSKLIASLKTKDAESAKRYGVETDYSTETRLAVSVRILLARATLHLAKLESARPDSGPFDYQLVRNMFRDFLPDLANW